MRTSLDLMNAQRKPISLRFTVHAQRQLRMSPLLSIVLRGCSHLLCRKQKPRPACHQHTYHVRRNIKPIQHPSVNRHVILRHHRKQQNQPHRRCDNQMPNHSGAPYIVLLLFTRHQSMTLTTNKLQRVIKLVKPALEFPASPQIAPCCRVSV